MPKQPPAPQSAAKDKRGQEDMRVRGLTTWLGDWSNALQSSARQERWKSLYGDRAGLQLDCGEEGATKVD